MTSLVGFPGLWVGVACVDLLLFIPFDWGHGVLRALLLLALGGLVWWWRVARSPALDASTDRRTRFLAAFAGVGLAINLGVGLHRFVSSRATGQPPADQAASVIAALRLVRHGVNPWSTTAVTDGALPELIAEEVARRPECRPATAARFADCAPVIRLFSSLGFKYGPVMLAFYAPFVAALGAAGIALSHLLLFVALVGVLGGIARAKCRSWWWTSLALVPLICTAHIAWNILDQNHLDMLPVLLAILGLVCMRRQAWGLAAVSVGLSINAKFVPGLLVLPPLLAAPRRFAALALTIALVGFLPMALLDWRGLWFNMGYPLARDPDSTALMFLLPPSARIVLRLGAVVALIATGVASHTCGWNGRASLNWLIAAHLIVLGTGSTLHNNYLVWLLPLLTLLIADGPGAPADTAVRQTV